MENFACYGKQADVESVAFAALTVTEPMIQKIGLADIINQHLPVDP